MLNHIRCLGDITPGTLYYVFVTRNVTCICEFATTESPGHLRGFVDVHAIKRFGDIAIGTVQVKRIVGYNLSEISVKRHLDDGGDEWEFSEAKVRPVTSGDIQSLRLRYTDELNRMQQQLSNLMRESEYYQHSLKLLKSIEQKL